MIFHVALRSEWADALTNGEYRMSTRGRTLDEEGFIHASTAEQLAGTRERFYGDLADDELVILEIDESALDADVRYEPPAPGHPDLFPHVYGPIPTTAVTARPL